MISAAKVVHYFGLCKYFSIILEEKRSLFAQSPKKSSISARRLACGNSPEITFVMFGVYPNNSSKKYNKFYFLSKLFVYVSIL